MTGSIAYKKYDFTHQHRQSKQTDLVASKQEPSKDNAIQVSAISWGKNSEYVWQPARRSTGTKKPKGADRSAENSLTGSFGTSRIDSAGTEIVRSESDNSQGITILSQPSFDTWTLDLALLHSLLHFTETSPGTGFGFYELFPSATDHFFQLAMGNDGLRHTLLALVGVVKDTFSGTGQSEFYLTHKAMSLRYLQEQISSDKIDEILMLSVVMQIGTDFTTGNFPAIRRHCHGLYLIWLRLKEREEHDGENSSTLGALARVIIRMGVRSDFVTAPFFDTFPEWPVFTRKDEEEDRRCFSAYSGISNKMTSDGIEWALASFEIDNLHHRVYRFAKRSNIYRTSRDPSAEKKIQAEYRQLVRHLDAWKQRRIVNQQELEHGLRQTAEPDPDPRARFLWYRPEHIENPYCMKLVQQWRAIWIRASTIVHPFSGPEPQSSHNRLSIAIDICRTHAALKIDTVLNVAWESLYYAGLVFGGKRFYPRECDWIMERSRGIAKVFYFLAPVVEAMPSTWEQEHVDWNGYGELLKRMER